mmetsp:Transcript_10534/g.47931  ORF Transcript_10534/g.47931 Transcript_10534/m.47931 type:complete len:224 (-) Transcript_10534:2248-2919(-)
MRTLATSHICSHSQYIAALTRRGASGFVGKFQLPFRSPAATAATAPTAAIKAREKVSCLFICGQAKRKSVRVLLRRHDGDLEGTTVTSTFTHCPEPNIRPLSRPNTRVVVFSACLVRVFSSTRLSSGFHSAEPTPTRLCFPSPLALFTDSLRSPDIFRGALRPSLSPTRVSLVPRTFESLSTSISLLASLLDDRRSRSASGLLFTPQGGDDPRSFLFSRRAAK